MHLANNHGIWSHALPCPLVFGPHNGLQVGTVNYQAHFILSSFTVRAVSIRELIHITSLGLMPREWWEFTADGSILAAVISPDMSLRSEWYSCLRSLLDNAIPKHRNLHIIYTEIALHLSGFEFSIHLSQQSWKALMRCLMSNAYCLSTQEHAHV